MIYRLLRWISGIMLHWFYSEIRVDRIDRIPPSGPLLVAVNHPNAMVDSLVAGWVVPRRLRLTAPWWFWNMFGEQAVFLLSRQKAANGRRGNG